MKTNKLWSIMMMLILVCGTAITFSACGDDDNNIEENTPGNNTSTGGGAEANNILGSYTAVTDEGYNVTVLFTDNGTGIITKKGSSISRQSFTYSMGGDTGIMKTEKKTYIIKIVEGFILLEVSESSSDRVELILYKDGQDLGKPDTKKIVGTWIYTDTDIYWSYPLIFNNNGTGTLSFSYDDTSYSSTFTYTMKNPYIGEIEIRDEELSLEATHFIVIGNKMYAYNKWGIQTVYTRQ